MSTLPEARRAAETVIAEVRRTEKVAETTRKNLRAELPRLPKSDRQALLEWVQTQLSYRLRE
jgi:hypothetical protein